MIELHITKRSSGYGKNDTPTRYDTVTKYFTDLKAAREWLREEYGKSKRQNMYVDSPEGSKRVGYVIGFRNYEYYNGKKLHFYERHWVEFRSVKTIDPMKGE